LRAWHPLASPKPRMKFMASRRRSFPFPLSFGGIFFSFPPFSDARRRRNNGLETTGGASSNERRECKSPRKLFLPPARITSREREKEGIFPRRRKRMAPSKQATIPRGAARRKLNCFVNSPVEEEGSCKTSAAAATAIAAGLTETRMSQTVAMSSERRRRNGSTSHLLIWSTFGVPFCLACLSTAPSSSALNTSRGSNALLSCLGFNGLGQADERQKIGLCR